MSTDLMSVFAEILNITDGVKHLSCGYILIIVDETGE